MCRKLFLLTLVLLVAGSASALTIPVVNPGFEDPVLDEDGWTWGDVPGWTLVGGEATDVEGSGVWNVTLNDFDPVMAPEGENVLFTEYLPGGVAKGVAQVLTETFAADTDYTLTVEVGNSYYYYNGGYSIQLLAGETVIAEDNDTLWPEYKAWATSTVAYTYDPNDEALVGQPLEIRLLNLELDKDSPPADTPVGVEFDNVRLWSGDGPGAIYVWNGSAEDGLWETPANWTVAGSTWTWPNEETGDRDINLDTLMIDILDGGAVTRGDRLHIENGDESTTAVLTLDNASSLTVTGRLSVGKDLMGELNVLGGSTLTILAGDNGDDLYAADDSGSTGTINIIDSIVDVADTIVTDSGEGYINISGSSTITADGITVADSADGVGYLDISGSATVNLTDDFKVDEGIGTITIGGDAVVSFDDDGYLPDKTGEATVTITDNAVLNVGDDITIADDAGTVGHMIITGNATVNAPDEFYLADDPNASAVLDVNGTATLNVGDDLDVGEDGPAVCNIGEDAVVTVADTIYIPHNQQGIEAGMTISGNATVSCDDLQVVNDGGNSGYLHISGNPTITMNEFLMNNDEGDPGTSEVIMDGGTVTVNGTATINDDNNGTATFTLNGGTFYCSDYLNVSDNLDGTAHLTINGGKMITGDRLRLGKDGGEDTGQVRIFMNGGLLQAEELSAIKITDTKIIFAGGTLRINSADVSEEDMQQLIDDGTIVLERDDLFIATDGNYTILSEPLVSAWSANPADGATGMSTTPVITTYVSEDVPKTIQDLQPTTPSNTLGRTTSILNIADSVTILDLNVKLDIRMPGNNADLNVYLKSPDGKQVELFTDVGFEQSNFKNTIIDDEASKSIRDGSGSFTGIFKPEGRLRDFDGRNTAGGWVLKIEDDWRGNVGTLNAWEVVVASPIVLSWNPGVDAAGQNVYLSDDFDDVSNRAGGALLASLAGDAAETEAVALEWDTTYYWAVDAVDANDVVVGPGEVWSFATAPSNASAEVRIAAGDDDAEEHLNDNSMDLTSSDLEFPYEDFPVDDPQIVGLRFVDVGIPASAQITEASIEFTTDGDAPRDNGTELVNVLIGAQLAGDAEAFADEAMNISQRTLTNAVAPWAIDPWATAGAKNQSADITALVEELIGLDDWASGNAMVFTIQDDPDNPSEGIRAAESYDGSAANAPLLRIVGVTETAQKPLPADGTVDLAQDDIVFSWEPGNSTIARDVYFGTEGSLKFVGTTSGITYMPGKLAVSTTYYLRVDEIEANGTKHEGPVWSFTTIIGEATDPDPADGAVEVPLDVVLSWTPGATAVASEIYFGVGTDLSPMGITTESSFDTALLGGLRVGNTYSWRIDSIEEDGTKHVGDVWTFASLNGRASEPDPADGAVLEQAFALLQWTAGLSAASHDVYISDNMDDVVAGAEAAFAGNLTETSLSVGVPDSPAPDGLAGATWYWRVDAVEDDPNVVHEGEIWSFTVPPLEAYDPSPADGAENVDRSDDGSLCFSWTAGLGAKLHTFYFGDDPNAVAEATGEAPLPMTEICVIALEAGKTYYWRVDEFDGSTTTKGVVWSFTTTPAEPEPEPEPEPKPKASDPTPADGANILSTFTTLGWTAVAGAVSHDLYISDSLDDVTAGAEAAFAGNQTDTVAVVGLPVPGMPVSGGLAIGATYYWRVDEVAEDGSITEGDVWSFTVGF